jgi:cytochrome c oxidase subunit II
MNWRRAICAGAALPVAGCNSFQNALGADGADGLHFVQLFTIFMIVCSIMYVLIVGGLFAALWRSKRNAEPLTVETGQPHEETQPVSTAMLGWSGLILVGLVGLTVASFFTDRSNAAAGRDPQLLIRVTANQWWWDVQYQSGDVSKNFRTANELHLPVGVPAEVTLQSNDVIHSFWIPNLAGKQDLIPGRVSDIQLVPRRTGIFRGQCAEFCGVQHANMALDVMVESRADFRRWVAAQQRVAFAPANPVELAGLRYFTTRQCSACHNVGGSLANATVGPDLTHLASRRSIAAGTMPMSEANLQAWLADPQAQKPGNNMPKVPLTADELHSLTAYLARLK